MPNKRSGSDGGMPSPEIKKQRLTPSIEDKVHEVAIKREAEASPSASTAAPPSPLAPGFSDLPDDNAPEDTNTPQDPLPCSECAQKLFSEGPGGEIIGPLKCLYSDEEEPCSECTRLNLPCTHLTWPARATAAEIQKMKPGRKALKATQALSARLKSVWKVLDRTDAKLTELRNINRNLFRVVNELRESNSKEPLDLGYLEDFSSAWDETEDGKYE
ncbi:hypothetical protein ASPCAL09324 [Aspergillus calidoustus]|uniref:Uncharacterized protein n=1 Tax=Aspergillus calidoustus TaxID=454130 RepID=A0A0U5GV63_ASPCI|nr:hypothetical protein ASPCAL09324 [Aspergillus calidoustus]